MMQICVCKWLHPPTTHHCIGHPRSLTATAWSRLCGHISWLTARGTLPTRILLPSRDERNLGRYNCTVRQPAYIAQMRECLVTLYMTCQFTQTVTLLVAFLWRTAATWHMTSQCGNARPLHSIGSFCGFRSFVVDFVDVDF